MSDARELLPCPFCGGEAERDTWDKSRDYAGCRPCDYWVSVDLWNRRATPDDVVTVPRDTFPYEPCVTPNLCRQAGFCRQDNGCTSRAQTLDAMPESESGNE